MLQIVNDKIIRPEVDGIDPNLPINTIRISRSQTKSSPTTNATTGSYYLSFTDKDHPLLQKLGGQLLGSSVDNGNNGKSATFKDGNKALKEASDYTNDSMEAGNTAGVGYAILIIIMIIIIIIVI